MGAWRLRLGCAIGCCVLGLTAGSDPQAEAEAHTPTVQRAVIPAVRETHPSTPIWLDTIAIAPAPHPLDQYAPEDQRSILRADLWTVGSVSVGRPNRGALANAVQLASSPWYEVVNPARAWATAETIDAITSAIAEVHRTHAPVPKLFIGDLSRRTGGYLPPHRSHQSGRDVDIGLFYLHEPAWYVPATAKNLDRARTWALMRALVQRGNVEYLFVDRSIQQWVREYAEAAGEDRAWLDSLFASATRPDALIRHAWGHRTHLHVRFFNDVAQESGRRLSRWLGLPMP